MNRGWEVMDGAAGDMGKCRINIRDKEKGIFISVFEPVRQWQRRKSGGRGKIFLLCYSSGGFILSFFQKKKKKKNFPVCTSECLPAKRSAGDHA